MWIQTLGKLLPKLINLSQSRQHPIVGATPCLRIQWSELKLLQPSTRVTFKTQVAPPTFWIENFQLLDMKKSIPIIHEGTNVSWETKYSKYGLLMFSLQSMWMLLRITLHGKQNILFHNTYTYWWGIVKMIFPIGLLLIHPNLSSTN